MAVIPSMTDSVDGFLFTPLISLNLPRTIKTLHSHHPQLCSGGCHRRSPRLLSLRCLPKQQSPLKSLPRNNLLRSIAHTTWRLFVTVCRVHVAIQLPPNKSGDITIYYPLPIFVSQCCRLWILKLCLKSKQQLTCQRNPEDTESEMTRLYSVRWMEKMQGEGNTASVIHRI